MAVKQFYHSIDLLNVGQLVGARLQNVTNASQATLAATLTNANKGLSVYNTDLKRVLVWDGTVFVQQEVVIDGDIQFKSVIANPATPALELRPGNQYVVGADGTLVQAGITFIPSATVKAGDQVLVTSTTTAYVIQRNIDDVRIDNIEAKNLEQDGRLDLVEAKNVEQDGRISSLETATVYTHFATVDLVAGVPATVAHNLGLSNKDAFTIRTALGGSDISVDVDSVNAESITLTSLVSLTGVSVMIIGK